MNKRNLEIIENYNNSTLFTVLSCYRKPSYYKLEAEYKIVKEMHSNGGHDYRIIGFNSSFFSCGYLREHNNRTVLVYHTHTNRRVIDIETGIEYKNIEWV